MLPKCECKQMRWKCAAAAIAVLLGLQIGLNVRAIMAEACAAKGVAARQANNPAAAAQALNRAVALAPFRPDFAYELGAARRALGDLEGARRALEASLRGGPNNVHAVLAAAQLETEMGNPETARGLVEKAHVLLPRYWRVALASAVIEMNVGEPRGAIDTLRAALEMPGVERGPVMAVLARAYADLGDSAQALACTEKAATLRR